MRLFTSESVTEGHPDKLADQISDSVLDAVLAQDPAGRVAVEVLLTGNRVFLGGEVSSSAVVDYEAVARGVLRRVGYDAVEKGIDADTCEVVVAVGVQSPDIAAGVDVAFEERVEESLDPLDGQGAGDQGLMFGYASDETASLMPLAVHLAHELAWELTRLRREEPAGVVLRPDGKTQVTVGYDEAGRAVSVETVVVSTQHDSDVDVEGALVPLVRSRVVDEVLGRYPHLDVSRLRVLVNPTGRFVIGGPEGDAGVTGRKIIVDTYGGAARHGGGAFSGKDPSKVDRSAAYALRWVARNVVAAGLASRCELQVAYAIGAAHPVSLYVDTFGTGVLSDEVLAELVGEVFDLRPAAIIRDLALTDAGIGYGLLCVYGHFGDAGYRVGPWENDDRVEVLREAAARRGVVV